MNRDFEASNHDEAIERTLAGLREVEVPAALEDRVLRVLRGVEEEAVSDGRLGWFAGWIVWAGVGAACAAMVLFAFTSQQGRWVSRAGQDGAIRAGRTAVRSAAATLPVASSAAEPSGVGSEMAVTPVEGTRVRVESGRAGERVRGHSAKGSVRRVSMPLGRSLPLPEPPLTEEEKLLQRVVRSGNQQEMALLNPQERAKEEASARADFRAFAEQQN